MSDYQGLDPAAPASSAPAFGSRPRAAASDALRRRPVDAERPRRPSASLRRRARPARTPLRQPDRASGRGRMAAAHVRGPRRAPAVPVAPQGIGDVVPDRGRLPGRRGRRAARVRRRALPRAAAAGVDRGRGGAARRLVRADQVESERAGRGLVGHRLRSVRVHVHADARTRRRPHRRHRRHRVEPPVDRGGPLLDPGRRLGRDPLSRTAVLDRRRLAQLGIRPHQTGLVARRLHRVHLPGSRARARARRGRPGARHRDHRLHRRAHPPLHRLLRQPRQHRTRRARPVEGAHRRGGQGTRRRGRDGPLRDPRRPELGRVRRPALRDERGHRAAQRRHR